MRTLSGLIVLIALCACVFGGWVVTGPIPLNDWVAAPRASFILALGKNPSPVQLVRPVPPDQLSAMAQLGKQLFFDKNLSASGRLACASCHDPQKFFGPPTGLPVVYGGADMNSPGLRAVPSLEYLETNQNFSIGPDPAESDTPATLPQLASASTTKPRATKTAQSTATSAGNLVPVGGLFWDGRANTLMAQASVPLTSRFEMDGGNTADVAAKLKASPLAPEFMMLFGPGIFDDPRIAVAEAMFAIARYQIEDPDFHPYNSKYDAWLEGRARLTSAEMRGYQMFNDPAKGDCGACHLDQPLPDGRPPVFTDTQYEALGVPRNPQIPANANASYYDMGICGPLRQDAATLTQYCGMFLTPTLRNSATRQVFFHNGFYHNLRDVVEFYNLRDVAPGKIYPPGPDGKPIKFNDLPSKYWANIDTADPPLDRKLGDGPALSSAEVDDIVAFLKTLTDGYRPAGS
jgi:cytochrome c peroxidase